MPNAQQPLRKHLLAHLDGENAHRNFDHILQGLPPGWRGERPAGLPYSPWELLEHLRICQRDILDFCRNADYAAPTWPDAYWPDTPAPPSGDAWSASIGQFRDDLASMKALVREVDDLHAEIPHGDGQTYLREALLVADHNAYHLGQLVTVRRLLGTWPPE